MNHSVHIIGRLAVDTVPTSATPLNVMVQDAGDSTVRALSHSSFDTVSVSDISGYSDSSGVSGTADTALHTPDSVRAAHKAYVLKHNVTVDQIPYANTDTTFVGSGITINNAAKILTSPYRVFKIENGIADSASGISDVAIANRRRATGTSGEINFYNSIEATDVYHSPLRLSWKKVSTDGHANRFIIEKNFTENKRIISIFDSLYSSTDSSKNQIILNDTTGSIYTNWQPVWVRNYRPSDSLAIDNNGSYKQGVIKSISSTDSLAAWKNNELVSITGSTMRTLIGAATPQQISDSLDIIRDTLTKHADTLEKYKDHANLNNLNSSNYTHLTSTNHTDLTDAGASTLHYHASDRDRANHTGTQAQSTIIGLADTLANRLPLHGKADSATVANGLNHGVTQYYLPYASTATAFNESIMSTAFSQIYVDGTLNARYGNLSLSIGADNGDKSTVTDNTNKTAKVFAPQYDTDDPGVCMFYLSNDATTNGLSHGGGTSSLNAVTSHSFYTAANNSTLTGTKRLGIASDGTIDIGVCSNAGTDVDKFLVLDATGNVDYRTGAEVLSDISGISVTELNALDGIHGSIHDSLDVRTTGSGTISYLPAWTSTGRTLGNSPFDITSQAVLRVPYAGGIEPRSDTSTLHFGWLDHGGLNGAGLSCTGNQYNTSPPLRGYLYLFSGDSGRVNVSGADGIELQDTTRFLYIGPSDTGKTLKIGYGGKIVPITGDTTFQAYCSLYDDITYRARVNSYFKIHGDFITITMPGITGTLSGGVVFIRCNPYIKTSLVAAPPIAKPAPVFVNGSMVCGFLNPYSGHLVIWNSTGGNPAAGTGGVYACEITYRWK